MVNSKQNLFPPTFADYSYTCSEAELLAGNNRNQNIQIIHSIAYSTCLVVIPILMFVIGPLLYWNEVRVLIEFVFRQVEAYLGLKNVRFQYDIDYFLSFAPSQHLLQLLWHMQNIAISSTHNANSFSWSICCDN